MRRTAAPSKLINNNKYQKLETKYNARTIESQQRISEPIPKLMCKEDDKLTYFSVAYGKPSKKKHKTWDGDGFISISESVVKLINSDGTDLGSSIRKQLSKVIFEDGATFHIGGKFVEILSSVKEPIFDSGEILPPQINSNSQKVRSFVNKVFRQVLLPDNNVTLRINDAVQQDEHIERVLMPRPSAGHIFRYNQSCSSVQDVVLDPRLACHMRPHQIDGMIFLYECVLGLRSHGGTGAILADAMGLGKTIQAIALIWTLLNQGPYDIGPLIHRCIIVCPSSLVLNWKNEFEKWIPNNRVRPFCVTGDTRVETFTESAANSILILSYEMLIRNLNFLQELSFDLIVCDEAHRLKNANIKTTLGVESLGIPRRILLTGTPLQNDMDEFFVLVDFSNPGVLGCDKETFRKKFVVPISAAREPNAPQVVIDHGNEMSLVLQRLTQSFILRRTEIVNTRYLPPKDEFIIFCSPSNMQLQLYRLILDCQILQKHFDTDSSSGAGIDALSCIMLLRKLCNDPMIFIRHVIDKENAKISPRSDQESTIIHEINKKLKLLAAEDETWKNILSSNFDSLGFQIFSGKLWVTMQMLSALKRNEKIVLASHFTQTLNLLQALCIHLVLPFQRIDGNTPSASRMRIVTDFNKTGHNQQKEVLLLSCKAGGEGLNLIGASKIILYDIDWNPATDAQTMARVWRDGQKGRVAVYRLITTGTVEESLLQRQVAKQQLSTSIVDLTGSSHNATSFSKSELKDIFTLHWDSSASHGCWTHQLLNCNCQMEETISEQSVLIDSPRGKVNKNCQLGLKQVEHKNTQKSSIAQLNSWCHWIGLEDISRRSTDNLILNSVDQISCVFMRTVTTCDDK